MEHDRWDKKFVAAGEPGGHCGALDTKLKIHALLAARTDYSCRTMVAGVLAAAHLPPSHHRQQPTTNTNSIQATHYYS